MPVSGGQMECLLDTFQKAFDLQLQPLTAGTLAMDLLQPWGMSQAYELLRPTQFVLGPEGEGQMPEYPWLAGSPARDFLGNEFLVWLWHTTETHGGTLDTERGKIAIVLDRAMDLECAYGQTGKDGLRGDGPARSPEARQALKLGKLPRKAGLIIETGGSQYELLLNPELMAINACKLPEVEDAETARAEFEERIKLIHDLVQGLDALFARFLKLRISPAWADTTAAIRTWATSYSPAAMDGKTKPGTPKKSPIASAA